MKKSTLSKIIVFTLCCIITSATLVNAKEPSPSKNYSDTSICRVDPHPEDPDNTHH